MKKNTIPFGVFCVLTLSLGACSKSSDNTGATVQPPPTSCVAPQVLKDGTCQTPSVVVSTAQVKIEAVTGVTIQPDYKIITTAGDKITISDINNKTIATPQVDRRQLVVLVDDFDEPQLAAIQYDSDKVVTINDDTTAEYFLISNSSFMGYSPTNVQLKELLTQIKKDPLYEDMKHGLAYSRPIHKDCPISYACNSYAADRASELLEKYMPNITK